MHVRPTSSWASVISPCLMFRKFQLEDISTQNQVKSSIQRGIRGAKQTFRLPLAPTSSRLFSPHSLVSSVNDDVLCSQDMRLISYS